MRFLSLGSGSRGNATLLQSGESLLLVDCGFSLRELTRRLAMAGLGIEDIDALLLTHEHSDHIRGAQSLSRQHGVPVWGSAGTLRACSWHEGSKLHQINANASDFRIGGIRVTPFTVPHDAAEPCQYVFSDLKHRFGILTDTGSVTAHIVSRLQGLDALLSTGQMPPGIPVATVAVGKPGAVNAGILAAQILAVSDPVLADKLVNHKAAMAAKVEEMAKDLPPDKVISVMGCIVNGPGESKAANIGISLPGTGEEPQSNSAPSGLGLDTDRLVALVGRTGTAATGETCAAERQQRRNHLDCPLHLRRFVR